MSVEELTGLVWEVFRLNGALIAGGDALVADLGLTSARWQVLGAVVLNGAPLTVAHIAGKMGLTRQSVQRLVNEMAASGLVVLADNPHHARSRLVDLSASGRAVYAAAMARYAPWGAGLAEGIPPATLAAAADTLRALRRRLEDGTGG